MDIRRQTKILLRKTGYDIIRFAPVSHPLARRKRILESCHINTVLDIGANTGQYARQLRQEIGYTNKIISFEPLSAAFDVLKANAKPDNNWQVFNFALGDTEEKTEINIADNSYSSSMLEMLPAHLTSAPQSRYIGKEAIEVKTLDSIFSNLCKPADKIYMKIDTQGFEQKVLKGAEKSLSQIDTVQMEMSLVPLYQGEHLFAEMLHIMAEKGYNLIAIEPGFTNPDTGQLLQVDGIFHRLQSL